MADQPRWLSMFASMFLYRTPYGNTYSPKNILKNLQVRFTHQGVPATDWGVLVATKLYSNDRLVGESFVDGTGWVCFDRMTRGVGVYQKKGLMRRLIREHMHVITEEHDDSLQTVIYFKHKPIGTKFTKSGRGFTEWVTSKYAAV